LHGAKWIAKGWEERRKKGRSFRITGMGKSVRIVGRFRGGKGGGEPDHHNGEGLEELIFFEKDNIYGPGKERPHMKRGSCDLVGK